MGKSNSQQDEPRGIKWSYTFKSPTVEGIISVGFKTPVQNVAVIFRPPTDGTANDDGHPTSLVCIQMFDASDGKDPCSNKAAELTQFPMPSSPKETGKLLFTFELTNNNGTPVSYIVLSGKDSKGASIKETINIGATGDFTSPGFSYTVIAADQKKQKFVLEISEWPQGDPLVSFG